MRMHHIGVVVASIDGIGRASMLQLGLRPLTEVIADPRQRVRVQFWGSEAKGSVVELVEPDGPSSPVARALEKGGGLNHICYEVEDFEAACHEIVERGAVCVVQPVPAVAFDGRLIAFFFLRGIGLIEYLQAPEQQG